MAVFKNELATDIILPHISVYRKYRDGVHCAYEVFADEGFVMYDKTAQNTELDPETNVIVPVTYYYTWISCPLNCDFATFSYVAAERTGVNEKYVFDN